MASKLKIEARRDRDDCRNGTTDRPAAGAAKGGAS